MTSLVSIHTMGRTVTGSVPAQKKGVTFPLAVGVSKYYVTPYQHLVIYVTVLDQIFVSDKKSLIFSIQYFSNQMCL